jgi:hypothetical protein
MLLAESDGGAKQFETEEREQYFQPLAKKKRRPECGRRSTLSGPYDSSSVP